MRYGLSVPGNLLLCGEYAILEPGGLGLCLAVERRVRLTARPAPAFSLVSVLGREERHGLDGLPACVLEACRDAFGSASSPPPLACRVDSSDFFGADGAKLGFGSSAAVAVGLAALFLVTALGEAGAAGACLPVALAAHRAFQGGRGSGYDVYASYHGGCGLFSGGAIPQFQPVRMPSGLRFVTIRGPRPESSGNAAARYRALRETEPAVTGRFLPVSNRLVRRTAAAAEPAAFVAALGRTALPGCWIGRRLGIPAEPPALAARLAVLRAAGWVAKASGAGGETAVAVRMDGCLENSYLFGSTPPAADFPLETVTVALEGLAWR
jgi:phosphomevalonate kinase